MGTKNEDYKGDTKDRIAISIPEIKATIFVHKNKFISEGHTRKKYLKSYVNNLKRREHENKS